MLPIEPFLNKVGQVLENYSVLLLRASPGSGKTTRVPDYLNRERGYRVLVLEPRRVAATNAARFIAEHRGEEIGISVGYQVRFDYAYSHDTQILFVTEALLLKFLLNNPNLTRFNCIVLDEFHERAIFTDVALGILKELLKKRSDLKLVIMSATLEDKAIKSYFDSLYVLDVPGVTFPLELHHSPFPQLIRIDHHWYQRMQDLILHAMASRSGYLKHDTSSLLVFLPGRGECEQLKKKLLRVPNFKWQVDLLHGQLTLNEQKRVLQSVGKQRIILATNVAESSVTVPDVSIVIDSGLERVGVWNEEYRLNEIQLKRISLASHKQRAGRAARLGPGHAYLSWMRADELSMNTDILPEVLVSDLRAVLLMLLSLNITAIDQFAWLTKPKEQNIKLALAHLKTTGCVDDQLQVTDLGKKIIALPFDFDASYFLVLLSKRPDSLELLAMGLIWAEGRLFLNLQSQNENNVPGLIQNDLLEDIESVLNDFHFFCRFQKSMSQVAKALGIYNPEVTSRQFLTRIVERMDTLRIAFIHAYLEVYPMRLGVVRESYPNKLLLSNGKGAILKSNIVTRSTNYYVCLEMSLVEGIPQVRKVMGVTLDELLQLPNKLLNELETWYESENKNKCYRVKQTRFHEIVLKETRFDENSIFQDMSLIRQSIIENSESFLKHCTALNSVLKCWKWWANRSDVDSLLPELFEFLIDEGLKQNRELSCLNYDQWIQIFYQLIDYTTVQRWQSECPPAIELPSGRRAFIKYGETDNSLEIEVKLKDLYGLKKHPLILNQPIRIVILGPNCRPIQITQNIETFWKLSYFEIRKELKGRYPKHLWPDDPTVLPSKTASRGLK